MRHDDDIIKMIHKRYGAGPAKKLSDLPFFYISREEFESIKPELKKIDVDLRNFEDNVNVFPFPEFCFMLGSVGWTHVKITGNDTYSLTRCIGRNGSLGTIYSTDTPELNKKFEGILVGENVQLICEDEKLYAKATPSIATFDKKTQRIPGLSKKLQDWIMDDLDNNFDVDTAMDAITATLVYFIRFFTYAELKHRVRVRPAFVKKPKDHVCKQKPWLDPDRPHYIYLNAPQKDAEFRSNTDAKAAAQQRRGHHRRACWVTLRDERFKHHPKYGQRIRRRATWVGPKYWTVNGTIYTVDDD